MDRVNLKVARSAPMKMGNPVDLIEQPAHNREEISEVAFDVPSLVILLAAPFFDKRLRCVGVQSNGDVKEGDHHHRVEYTV